MTRDIREFDVVVVGGGAGGVAAAVGAARSGARTALIERHGYFGGCAIASSVLTYCGFFDHAHTQVVAGVGQLFLDHLASVGLYLTQTSQDSGNKVVLLDLETTKLALDTLVVESGVTTFLHSDVFAARTEGDRITELDFLHPGGPVTLRAKAFVDSSGDGALLRAADALTSVSPLDDRQASTLVMRVGGVREDADLTHAAMTAAVTAYRAETGAELTRDHGSAVRLPVSREIMVLIADEHLDMLDVTEASSAELEGRRLAQHYFEAFRRSMPGWETSYLAATGPEIGVRETRRLVGTGIVDHESVSAGRKRPHDVIARGGWPMEDHKVPGVTSYGGIKDDGWYDIPYGSIASASHANLWAAGRLISSDKRAFASTRVMGTAFATGHAAGLAASGFARTGSSDVAAIQQELRDQGALL